MSDSVIRSSNGGFSFAKAFQWCCLTTQGSTYVTIRGFCRVLISDLSGPIRVLFVSCVVSLMG